MATAPPPGATAGDPGGVVSVDRAVADLRRGAIVAVRARSHGATAVVLAAEMATPESLDRLRRVAGSEPALAMSSGRAAALAADGRPAVPGRVLSATLPAGADDRLVRRLADPTVALDEGPGPAVPLAIVPEPADGVAAAAVALAKLARLLPSALFALAVGAEREPAAWARRAGLLLVDGEDVAAYPSAAAARLIKVAEAQVPLSDAETTRFVAFRPRDGGQEHVAIVIGRPDGAAPVLARLHSACLTGDLLGSLRCDCGDQLRGAIRAIAAAGGGVLLYLAQEGRDIGLANKLRAYRLQDAGLDTIDANEHLGFEADERIYLPAAEMLRQLGIRRVRLLTNNPQKVAGLAAAGIEVSERVAHAFPANPHNDRYLATKAKRAGHLF